MRAGLQQDPGPALHTSGLVARWRGQGKAVRLSRITTPWTRSGGSQSLKQASTTTNLAVNVWRSARAGGDTKTQKSHRTLEVPDEVARALKQHHTMQAARRLRAGETWQDNDLVFCTRNGRPLAAGNVRRAFRSITSAAGIGEDWTPRELRHTFVSIMNDNDVPIETIADLVGHRTAFATQTVYRHQLRSVIETGAAAMNLILNRQKDTGSA
jgi:integrase